MKRQIGYVSALCVLLLSLAGCKYLKNPEYELEVSVEAGVTGTPASGVYGYTELEEIAYTYTAEDARQTVEVLIDNGAEVAAANVIIYHDTVLVARLFDPRGPWNIAAVGANSITTDFTVMLSGPDQLSGIFNDDRGHYGTWQAENGSIVLLYDDLEGHKYVGAIPGMSGNWTWDNGTNMGTWSAGRRNPDSIRWK